MSLMSMVFSPSVNPVLEPCHTHTQETLHKYRGRRSPQKPAERSHCGGGAGRASRQSWAGAALQAVAPRALTHLGLLLMQLYLDVCQLGSEVFIGSLKSDDERFGLLALISPFLGHCSFLKGVCCFLIPFKRVLPCYCFFSWGQCFSIYCVVLLGKVSSAAALEALRRDRDGGYC